MSEQGRWVLLIASEVGRTDSVSDRAMERLVDAIIAEGYEVVPHLHPGRRPLARHLRPLLLVHPPRLGPRRR